MPWQLPRTPFNEAATAADASRDTICQGNCDVADLQLCSNIAPIRNTIPIQYPISNCPAKKGFLQTAVSKARRPGPRAPPSLSHRRASDTALTFLGSQANTSGRLADKSASVLLPSGRPCAQNAISHIRTSGLPVRLTDLNCRIARCAGTPGKRVETPLALW